MRALVLGAGGFIGHNLVKRLVSEGWEVDGVDLHYPKFEPSPAHQFIISDLSIANIHTDYDRIYQLAADMGGAGFVFTGENDTDILINSLSINMNVAKQLKGFRGKFFYSSSVCVYPDGAVGRESDSYPALPVSTYGWEKLTSERLYLEMGDLDLCIARFHNAYGPWCTYEGGREKSPAALCRKALLDNTIEVWGDGEQLRPFIYIDDLLDGIELLIASDIREPVNLGPENGITINQMLDIIEPRKPRKYIKGPTGELRRHTNIDLAKSLGFRPKISLEEGLKKTYTWIKGELAQDGRFQTNNSHQQTPQAK